MIIDEFLIAILKESIKPNSLTADNMRGYQELIKETVGTVNDKTVIALGNILYKGAIKSRLPLLILYDAMYWVTTEKAKKSIPLFRENLLVYVRTGDRFNSRRSELISIHFPLGIRSAKKYYFAVKRGIRVLPKNSLLFKKTAIELEAARLDAAQKVKLW